MNAFEPIIKCSLKLSSSDYSHSIRKIGRRTIIRTISSQKCCFLDNFQIQRISYKIGEKWVKKHIANEL